MRKATKLVAVLAAATLVIAACGDDSGDSSAETTASTAAPTTTAGGAGTTAAMGEKDIVDTAVAAGGFTTLATALEAAGLVETLKGPGPFTVFAPTDEAFAKVPKETLTKLLANKEALTRVLTYHVVTAKVMAADVKPGEVEMASKDKATIKVDGGKVMINDANVVKTDIVASNGVIHVIDAVLLPEGLSI
ncbi:MAG TPA: fasciclin domain-containing protein [Acidimicrobiales bacterium]